MGLRVSFYASLRHPRNMNCSFLFLVLLPSFIIPDGSYIQTLNKNYNCVPPNGSLWRVGCSGTSPFGLVQANLVNGKGVAFFNAKITVIPNGSVTMSMTEVINQNVVTRTETFYSTDPNKWTGNELYLGLQINGTNVTISDFHGKRLSAVAHGGVSLAMVNVLCANSTPKYQVTAALPDIDIYTGP